MKALGALLLLVMIILLARRNFGFYCPDTGMAAAGREETPAEPHQREVVRLVIDAKELRRFANAPTLLRLSEFYGVADSLPCSIRKTFDDAEAALAKRVLHKDQVASLCLN